MEGLLSTGPTPSSLKILQDLNWLRYSLPFGLCGAVKATEERWYSVSDLMIHNIFVEQPLALSGLTNY